MIGNAHFTLPTTEQDSLNICIIYDIQNILNILKQKQTLDSKVGNDYVEYTCALKPIRV